MQSNVNGKQTLWVLTIALVLISLCIGGLWAYVKSADAETGVQEASTTELPEEDEISVTWEKYDNFPPNGKEDDLEQKFIGTGLTRQEKARLPALIEAYTNKTGPGLRFPASPLPDMDDLAIVPLDPNDYAGMTEYYLLPGKVLDDELLLRLIDYSARKGETFSSDMLTSKNCSRGDYYHSNRYLSAGESERSKILVRRAEMEGLFLASPELSPENLPVKGVGSIARNYEKFNNYGSFTFYPIREMTDEELLQTICFEISEGYTNLKPEEDENLDPIQDAAKIRALLEEFMGMPMAAENYMLSYRRKNDTGETRLQADFNTAAINGKSTSYFVIIDQRTGQYLFINQHTWNQLPGTANRQDSTDQPTKRLHATNCAAIAEALVEKITSIRIASSETSEASVLEQTDEHIISEYLVNVHVKMVNGDLYIVNVRESDGVVINMMYNPSEQADQFLWS